MGLVVFFIVFLLVIGGCVWFFFKTRSELDEIRLELDNAIEEKDIVLDFMRRLSEDLGEVSEGKVYSSIVRATALSCRALSACFYEKMPDGTLKVRAREGLFPPQREGSRADAKNLSRVEFLEEVLGNQELESGEGLIGSVATSRKAILIKDASKDPRVVRHEDDALKITSMIIVPLVLGDELLGVLALVNPLSERAFDETNFSVAKSLASYAALAIKNNATMAQLVEKSKMDFDLTLASNVQSYLLPSTLPEVKGLSSAVRYKPHRKIGGDFYDFFTLPDGRYGVVVADVSGKGVSAAIITAICQTRFAYVAKACHSPAQTLKMLNSEMVSLVRSDMFVTMVYAILEADLSKITFARAGHEKPLFYGASGKAAREIRSPGIAVGMTDSEIFDANIDDAVLPFENGDIFTLYTDGVSETVNEAGEEFSSKRLLTAIESLHNDPAPAIIDGVGKAVQDFAADKTGYADDLTLLILKRIG